MSRGRLVAAACALSVATTAGLSVATPAAHACGASPRDAVVRFYRALERDRYSTAWSCLSTATRTRFGGYRAWRAGYAQTRWTRLRSATLVDQAAGLADLSVRIASCTDDDGDGRVESFRGRWSAINGYAGWRLSDPSLRRTSTRYRASC